MFATKLLSVGLAVILLAVAVPALAQKGDSKQRFPYVSGEVTQVDPAAKTIEVTDENGAAEIFKITPRPRSRSKKKALGRDRERSPTVSSPI